MCSYGTWKPPRPPSIRWLLTAALVVGLGACAPAAPERAAVPTVSAPGGAAPAAAANGWQADWNRTVAAAKQEGAVSIAGPAVQTIREVIMKFQDAYPEVRIQYTGLGAADFEARIGPERDAGQYLWDVYLDGISTTFFTVQIPAGWWDPLKSALIRPEVWEDGKWLGGFDAGYLDTGKTYGYGFSLRIQSNAKVNREVVPEQQLPSAEDLVKPEFKGRIAILDPRGRSWGANQVSAYRKGFGDEWFRRLLVDQEPVLTTDRRQLAEWVVRGRYPIGLGFSDETLTPFLEQGVGSHVRELKSSSNNVGAGNGALAVFNRAPHPNAARVFVNWLLSPEGQTLWALGTDYPSRRLDVPLLDPSQRPALSELGNYLNPSAEENAAFHIETMEMAKRLRP